jgi:glycosyltransferase involved in cell wall biosynthesis
MPDKQLSIVTTTYNCVGDVASYFEAFAALDPSRFDWIVVDAASTDGTMQFLQQRADRFAHFASEPDAGFYFGLNKAVASVKTPYYMVFGADDRPSPTLLDDALPLLTANPSLVFGAVRLMPSGGVKQAGPRWMHSIVWGRAVSHHSVGTIIRTDVHQRHGRYDTAYALVADGLLLKRLLRSDEPIARTSIVFGEFMVGGMSSKQELRSMVETLLLQLSEGANPILQLMLFNTRMVKRYVLRLFKRA